MTNLYQGGFRKNKWESLIDSTLDTEITLALIKPKSPNYVRDEFCKLTAPFDLIVWKTHQEIYNGFEAMI